MTDTPNKTAGFSKEQVEAAVSHIGVSEKRIPVSSRLFSEGVVGHFQRLGILRVRAVDYPAGKPLFADVGLTEKAREALNAR